MIILSLGNGIATGANSLISRYIGAEKYNQANNAGIHSILLSIIFSVILSVIILIFLKPILLYFNIGTSFKYIMDFSNVIFSCLFVFIFSSVLSTIFRAEGNIKKVTFASLFSILLNFILDPIFIYKLNLGIAGSAWATVISSLMVIIILSYWIWVKKETFLNLSYKHFSYTPKLIKKILNVGIPASLETIITAILYLIITSLLLKISGNIAVATMTASIQILLIAQIPLNGLAVGLLTVAAVAYGAKNSKNLNTAFSHSIKLGFILTLVILIIIVIFSSQIAYLFSYNNKNAILGPQITQTVSLLSLYVLVSAPQIMASSFFQGVGKGIYSLITIFISSLLLESIFAYLFSLILGWGVKGVYIGLIVGCLLGSIIAYIWVIIFMHKFKKDNTN